MIRLTCSGNRSSVGRSGKPAEGSNEGADQDRLRRIVDAIRDELEGDRLGGAAIAATFASSLMIIVLPLALPGADSALLHHIAASLQA